MRFTYHDDFLNHYTSDMPNMPAHIQMAHAELMAYYEEEWRILKEWEFLDK